MRLLARQIAGLFQPRRLARRVALVTAAGLSLTLPCANAAAAPSFLKLPRFDGEVSGDFSMPQNGLELHWRLKVESPENEPGIRRGRLELEGQGAHVVARASLDLATGVTQWEIEKAEADLAEIFSLVAPLRLPDFAHLSVTGTVTAQGGGRLAADGAFSGAAVVTITDAAIRDFFGGWSAEGLDARVELPSLPELRTAPGGKLALRSFSFPSAGVEMRDAATDAEYAADGRIHFSNTKVSGYGGGIAVEPFTLDPAAPAVATRVHVENIDSASLAAFLPGSVAEAQGCFSGELALRWSPQAGVVPGVGKLALVQAPGASIRMSKTPGFFTSNMEPRLYFLPESAGFLRRWFSLENPAYDTLKKIEEGEMPISVENITINFTPEGDEAGRSASVMIAARPSDPKSAVKNLRININITGPVSKMLEIGTADRVQIGF